MTRSGGLFASQSGYYYKYPRPLAACTWLAHIHSCPRISIGRAADRTEGKTDPVTHTAREGHWSPKYFETYPDGTYAYKEEILAIFHPVTVTAWKGYSRFIVDGLLCFL